MSLCIFLTYRTLPARARFELYSETWIISLPRFCLHSFLSTVLSKFQHCQGQFFPRIGHNGPQVYGIPMLSQFVTRQAYHHSLFADPPPRLLPLPILQGLVAPYFLLLLGRFTRSVLYRGFCRFPSFCQYNARFQLADD